MWHRREFQYRKYPLGVCIVCSIRIVAFFQECLPQVFMSAIAMENSACGGAGPHPLFSPHVAAATQKPWSPYPVKRSSFISLSIYLFIYLVGYLFYIWSTNLALFLHTAFICTVIQLYSAPSFFASLRPPFSCSLSPFLTYPQWSSFALDLGTHTSSEGSKLIRRQALTIGGLEEHFCFRETIHARAQTLLPHSSVGSRWASVRGCFIVCVFAAVCMCLPQACGYLDRLLSFFLSVQSANRTLLHALHWQLAARPAFSPNMTAASSQPCQM